MRALLVEDSALSKPIEVALSREGAQVDVTNLGEDAIDIAKTYEYHIIILDLQPPDISGLEVLRRLRYARVRTPVIALDCSDGLEQGLQALGYGADDVLKKPFHQPELIARIRAIVRRARGHADSVIRVGDLSIDLEQKQVVFNNRLLRFSPKEYAIIELLALQNSGAVKTETLMASLYSGLDDPDPRVLVVFICLIRRKLKRMTGHQYIETVRGQGYRLKPSARQSPPKHDRTPRLAMRERPEGPQRIFRAEAAADARRWQRID
jgi:two-component system cell cycle response regulator CtrA